MSPRPANSWVGYRVKMLRKVCGKPHLRFEDLTPFLTRKLDLLTRKLDRHRRLGTNVPSADSCMDDRNLVHHRPASNEKNVRCSCFSSGADLPHARHDVDCPSGINII